MKCQCSCGCEAVKVYAKGLCKACYESKRTHSGVCTRDNPVRRPKEEDPLIKWVDGGEYVDVIPETGCELSHACTDLDGYPVVSGNGKKVKLPRLVLERKLGRKLKKGKTRKDDEVVRHLCHTPLCVNENHLIVGTQKDNADDKVRAGRQAKGESHGTAKLTDLAVWLARRRYAQGKSTMKEIAEDLGCSHQQISNIVNGKQRGPNPFAQKAAA